MLRIKFLLALILGFSLIANAQKTPKTSAAKADTTKIKADTVKKAASSDAPKAYKDVITKNAVTSAGMFKIHKIDNQYFFEIPDTLLNRDILVVNRIAKAAAGLRPNVNVYAGDQIAENVIRFDLGPSNRIFMRRMVFRENSTDSTDNGMYRAVVKSNLQPIVAAFPVKAYGKDTVKSKSYVVDVTSFLQTENEIFYFSPGTKKGLSIGQVQNDKSYIVHIKPYPVNIEIRTVRTYQSVASTPNTTVSTLPVSYELNSSMLLLPETPMKSRYADDRVGFFSRRFVDFDANPQGIKDLAIITRWRLEPKDEDKEKYLRGELVEPENPIIFYIDPATPKKWTPYLIAGVNDWQKAFEQAGFKNAIKALPAPENDSTWNIDDARHNVIVYKASAIPNASGPHVHDPRSGEIMETHINWYHNIMYLLRNWYMVQAGAVDSKARKMQFDDDLMGELIRFVSSHEVGHTLGLRHNYGSSSTIPVEKLRDKAYVEQYGHTPSIMDYARFNYVAQPEDGITEKGIFPRIGEYDKWAIEWGYKWLPQFNSPEAEIPYLNRLIIDRLSADNRLFFGNESESLDPRSQSEDLGDNSMQASVYGIKNLQRILPNLKNWTKEPNKGYDDLRTMYTELLKQYRLYTAHVLKNIGGEYHTPKRVEEQGKVYKPVEYEKQKEAMRFLDAYLFTTPVWLFNDSIMSLTGVNPSGYITSAQSEALLRLQGSGILSGFIKNEELYKDEKTYPSSEFLEDLKRSIWSELYSHKPIEIHRRDLQKAYIDNAFKALNATTEAIGRSSGNGTVFYMNPDPSKSDVSSLIRAHLLSLKKDIKKAIRSQKGLSKYHLQDMAQRIDNKLSKN
ncbi:MAG: zinc-dependent metalloprotease [Prevotellaceae bacterium]|jgi:hypothetical protein|nr:zinc-dependent metalloprotease [Prevotellaceae bacterium]